GTVALYSRIPRNTTFEVVPATQYARARVWSLDEPPPPTVPSVAPLRSVAADVSRLKLHSRPAKKRPFEVIRLTPDATAGYGPSRSRHRRPRHPSAPFDQYVLGGKFTRAFALDLLLPRAILVSLGC